MDSNLGPSVTPPASGPVPTPSLPPKGTSEPMNLTTMVLPAQSLADVAQPGKR